MNLDSIDPSAISDILSSLSADDMENLKNMAESFFSADEKTSGKNETRSKSQSESAPSFDFQSMSKIMSIMSLLSQKRKDPRCDLLTALKPLVTDEKKSKVDQAVKMLEIMSLIPRLKELR